jgi:ATP-dependent helicase YprA (DUF1998 family)
VEAKGRGELLLLDGGDVEVRRRLDPSLGQLDAIVDRLHPPAAEHPARQELGRLDRSGELLEHGLTVRAQAEQQIGHEHRDEPRERPPEIGLHDLDLRIALPKRIG